MFRKLRRRIGTGEFLLFGMFIAIAAVAVVVLTPPGGSSSSTSATLQDWTQTSQGPLSPADRDFLAKVRQAGLWEIPTGQQAQQRSGNKLVKEVGMHLMTDHLKLDEEVRDIAARLNVVLPSQPNADQQGWMAQLSGLSGTEYDRTFAQLLRQAHGKVFGVVAGVRAGTRNDLIRSFAQRAVNVVMKHMALLESTTLPEPPAPRRSHSSG
jgi:predicted outer membrane protein